MANHATPFRTAGLILVLAIAGGTTVLWAQTGPAPAAAMSAAAAASSMNVTEADAGPVRLMVGRSTIVNVGNAITRVSLTSSDVADAMVTAPGQLLVNGKMPGTISMFVWDRGGSLRRYEVIVQRDLAILSEQIRELFPNEKIDVQSNGRNIVLAGEVSNKDVIEKAVSVAAGYVEKKDEVVTLLQVQNGAPTNQVLLRVRFAEVSRSAVTELGASLFTSAIGLENNLGRVTTQQFAAPRFDELGHEKVGENWQEFGHPVTSAEGKVNFSDFLNFFLFNEKYDLGMAVRALQSRGLFQSLAEPNLVAESGKEASFLAGGEFPIPVVQGSVAAMAVTVMFKEFGIRLNFTPTVVGDRVHLRVRPEVSTLDFNNAVTLQGFRIPALTTRRTETELELRNGQTFAIAGLMNNNVAQTLAKVPGIGDIPILGYLFKSKAAQKNQTELVVMITPEILVNNSRGVTPNLPKGTEPFLEAIPQNRQIPTPPEAFEEARRNAAPFVAPASNNRSVEATPEAAPVTAPDPVAAAAVVSNLTPSRSPKIAGNAADVAASRPPALADRPLSDAEKKALERAKKDDQERERERLKIVERAKAEEAKRQAEDAKRQAAQLAAEKRAVELQHERDEKLTREQARKDAEAKKRAEEEAQRELARQRERQKALDAAAAQLKDAQDRYNSEIAKNGQK